MSVTVHFFILWGFREYRTNLLDDPWSIDLKTRAIKGSGKPKFELDRDACDAIYNFVKEGRMRGRNNANLRFKGVSRPAEMYDP